MTTIQVGNVKKATLSEVIVSARALADDVPRHGAFVSMPGIAGRRTFGVINDIEITASELAVELGTDDLPEEVHLDQMQGGQGTVEILVKVTPIAHEDDGSIIIGTPPQPPVALQQIVMCEPSDVQRLTRTGDFIRPILALPNAANLAIAATREAMLSYPFQQRTPFLMLMCTIIQLEWMIHRGRECMELVRAIAHLRPEADHG